MIDIFVSKKIKRLENWCKAHETEGLDYGNEIEEQLNNITLEIENQRQINNLESKRIAKLEKLLEQKIEDSQANENRLQRSIQILNQEIADQKMQMQMMIEGFHSIEERLSRIHEI